MADAWGGSWGTPSAWDVSWGSGAGPSPPPPPTPSSPDGYYGPTIERRLRKKFADDDANLRLILLTLDRY